MEIEMNVKLQNASPFEGGGDNKGSCAALATYLEHEDEERLDEGKDIMPFLTPNGIEVTKGEVIDKIDRNHKHLGKNDDKFYSIIVSPSPEEIKAMGETEAEQYESGLKLIREISDSYAQNFNREGIMSTDDLEIFWKFHFTRGLNDELQFHMHGIVSRNSVNMGGRNIKLSPMTTHHTTKKGPVKGGFDRKEFFRRSEKLFDKLFHYDRKVAETFDYNNAQTHGTPEEKAEQTRLLTTEKSADIKKAITEGLARRRATVKTLNNVDEISALLAAGEFKFPKEISNSIEKAIDAANLRNTIGNIFDIAASRDALELNLMAAGISCSAIYGPEKGVDNICFRKNGKVISAKEIMDDRLYHRMINKWKTLTGDTTTAEIRSEIAAKENAERARKMAEKVSQTTSKLKIGR